MTDGSRSGRTPAPGRPSPLANLPRPISERDRRGGLGRRLRLIVAAGILGAGAFAVASSLSTGPLAPVGEVQGAIGSPSPRSEARPQGPSASVVRPTSTPDPTASPLPTPAPPETLTGYQ